MRYFEDHEFACHCGCGAGIAAMQPEFLVLLDAARQIAGVPFKLNSAMRCPVHNAKIGGVKNSPHLGGWAVDVAATDGVTRFAVLDAFRNVGVTRLGIAASYVHADIDPSKPEHVIWVYT